MLRPDPVTTTLGLLPMWFLFVGPSWLAVHASFAPDGSKSEIQIA